MKKSIIKTLAVSLIAASFFSVMTSRPAEANEFGLIGKKGSYKKTDAIIRYAKTLVDKTWSQMPDPVKIEGHWCAAFTKFLCGENEVKSELNRVTKTVDKYKDLGRFHYSDDPNYHPQIGDLIVYEESVPPINDGPDHIGVVVDVKTINGEDYPSTIEGNYFDIDCKDEDIPKISYEDYRDLSNANDYDTRRVGFVPYNRVRRHMVAGYIEMDRTSIDYTYGDVNADGNINSMDVMMIIYSVLQRDVDGGVVKESRTSKLSVPEYYYRMDVNGDGEVTQVDATLLKRYITHH